MNKIKVAIIEDEVPAARLLHEMIQSLRPDWEVMILPGTIEESVEWFRTNPPSGTPVSGHSVDRWQFFYVD